MVQFPMAERAAHALGIVVWPMVGFEAGDALATAAARFAEDQAVEQVLRQWGVSVRGAETLAASLSGHRHEVALYKTLATLRRDVPLNETLDDLEWKGARREDLLALCREIDDLDFPARVPLFRAA